ncbi:uncharacterized protein BX663DRAFT_472564 [Cokeromyces recurvatus]|uniref:uncharacterized protein n=1 Tax=Cokeromyces recurvatus TaxID=90255 RepID=UPI00221F23FE|nr:uncharacterized protein BX663DRAFT_472564 [Cokeromyces recurvatus]KAI7902949.1 hypothetical protein BX663DRAFT_472564 [Cokeromyces recurvatus]
MEAIDNYANDNIVRSVAYNALEKRYQHQFLALLPISSRLLRQRVRLLLENGQPESSEWNKVVQWQQDDCAQQIETLFSDPASADTIYQAPIYYKRKDVETLEAVLEFVPRSIIVLILEDGSGDISDIKYHNTKRVTEEEWLDIFENWSRTLEDAERIFLTRVTRTKQPKKIFTMADKSPEDYWGDWSSDEGSLQTKNTIYQRNPTGDNNNSTIKESDDSEDDYYTRWSQDPGTLTPNETPKRVLKSMDALQHSTSQLTMNQELEEEYDQSYNPLFTVPSVPNLMDAHTAALSELTHMLQASLPQQQQQQQQQKEEEEDQQQFPGAYPLSGTQSPVAQDPLLKEAGRSLFMKSLSALISAARLLGYDRQDILNMVQEIVNKQ